jgi:hypothetical protein
MPLLRALFHRIFTREDIYRMSQEVSKYSNSKQAEA